MAEENKQLCHGMLPCWQLLVQDVGDVVKGTVRPDPAPGDQPHLIRSAPLNAVDGHVWAGFGYSFLLRKFFNGVKGL